MFPQTDKSWGDYRALNQNLSYQPTLAGRAIFAIFKGTTFVTNVFASLDEKNNHPKTDPFFKKKILMEPALPFKKKNAHRGENSFR